MKEKKSEHMDFWDEMHKKLEGKTGHLGIKGMNDPVLLAALRSFGDLRGKRVLDIGCGNGLATFFFAKHGAKVVSIDTSEVAIKNIDSLCKVNNIDNVQALIASAQDIDRFGVFDCIFGSMILHHIDPFDPFVKIMRRSLCDGGKAFFCENNASSPLLMWFRKNIVGRFHVPKYSDGKETPFSHDKILSLEKEFQVRVEYPELLMFRLIPVYLFRDRCYLPFAWLDRLFYRLPFLRKYSYVQYIYLSKA
ncbi:MAG: class I SAM-dependent methyltransferase [Candidatus Aureabacteria bacterium]|nr:class I SAM-dependent methyltransferase [Candidatus Auribacterota bacterium]